MIPKISLYNFFEWTNGATGGVDAHSALFSEIAQAPDFHISAELPNSKKFEIQKELFELMDRIEFTLYSYGYLNFFANYQKDVEALPKLRELLDAYFEDKDIIEDAMDDLEAGISFYHKNKKGLALLADYEDPAYQETYDRLEAEIDFDFGLNNIMFEVFELILENPDNFCLDEHGNSIDPQYTGKIDTYSKYDGSKTIYNLKDGKFHGEVVKYFPDNKTIQEIFIKKTHNQGVDKKIKEWHLNGQLKYELIGYQPGSDYNTAFHLKDSKGWYEDGKIEHESKDGIYTTWYQNGNLKTKNIQSLKEARSWHPNGQLQSETIGNNAKYWDKNGKELTEQEYYQMDLSEYL